MITLPQHPEANQVLGEVATELGVRGVSAVPYMPAAGAKRPYSIAALGATIEVDSPLAGAHQQRNVALAIAAAVDWPAARFPITPGRSRRGFAGRVGRDGWSGSQAAAWSGFWTWRIILPARGLCVPACVNILESRGPWPYLQLPARQAIGRDGADSVSALRSGDRCAHPHGTGRGIGRSAGRGQSHWNDGRCFRIRA